MNLAPIKWKGFEEGSEDALPSWAGVLTVSNTFLTTFDEPSAMQVLGPPLRRANSFDSSISSRASSASPSKVTHSRPSSERDDSSDGGGHPTSQGSGEMDLLRAVRKGTAESAQEVPPNLAKCRVSPWIKMSQAAPSLSYHKSHAQRLGKAGLASSKPDKLPESEPESEEQVPGQVPADPAHREVSHLEQEALQALQRRHPPPPPQEARPSPGSDPDPDPPDPPEVAQAQKSEGAFMSAGGQTSAQALARALGNPNHWTLTLPSMGTVGHRIGQCSPCEHFAKGLCAAGKRCTKCHDASHQAPPDAKEGLSPESESVPVTGSHTDAKPVATSTKLSL